MFAPMYSDPNAPSHKLPPPPPPPPKPPPAPKAAVEKPPPPPPEVAPSRDKPYGACEPSAPGWGVCLGGAAQLADHAVEQTEHAVLAALGNRPGVNPVVADGAARGLRAAGDAWRVLRDRECSDLPLIEAGLTGSLYERRLMCRIRRDVERVEFLRQRYGSDG
jgi:hypothetical protein